MVQEKKKLWVYEVVEAGQEGRPSVVALTPEDIARYAEVSLNPDPRYKLPRVNLDSPMVPMPTMALTYAPLMREDIADANGFTALERSTTARRQTPFAKCEAQWWEPVQAGDTLTGTRRVLEKYERRSSRFVTFRVEAANQHGRTVARYDYTCIFDYAQGQREAPQDRGTATAPPSEQAGATPAQVNLVYPSFDDLDVGDKLAALSITESQEIINRKNDFRMFGPPSESNIHTDPEFARQGLFGGTVNSGPATMSYVDQTLEQSFPLSAFYNGGTLLMRAIEPFRAGDTVTFEPEVTAKRVEEGRKIVECRVRGVNQRGDLVSLSDARLVLTE